tara:strand:- start:721 stop:1485 length:765 start_codon:yes stop_codon:yes gene_type:complete
MGLLKKSSFKYKLYKNLFDSAICITGCSKYLINKFKISFPQIDSGKYLKLLNGVSKDFIFNQLSINKRNYFFSAGRFVNEKGFDLLISCFNPNKMDKLLIAGGNHKDLKKLGIQAKDNILLLGRLNKDEIIEKLLQAKITIIPSRHETFGIFILEAICCGSPLIATNVGGVKELIDDVKIKLGDEEKETFDHWVRIVEPDAQSITKEIIDLDNTKRSKEDYILTIQKIRREFVWEKRLEHYEKVIRENFKHAIQ